MTDPRPNAKESNYQDTADLRAENEKLRAEVSELREKVIEKMERAQEAIDRVILSLAAAPPAAPQMETQQPKRGIVKIDRHEFSVANGAKLTATDALKLLGKDPFAHGVWCIDKRDGDYMLDGWSELSEFHEYFTSPKIINAGNGKIVTPEQPAAPQDEELQRLLDQLDLDDYATVVWCETVERLFNALARKAGCR